MRATNSIIALAITIALPIALYSEEPVADETLLADPLTALGSPVASATLAEDSQHHPHRRRCHRQYRNQCRDRS